MARGNRDVQLVIRAKNEASRVLSSVSDALQQLKRAQADVARGASTTGSTLSQLGASIGQLNQRLGGASGFSRFAQNVTAAENAVRGMEAELTRLQGEQAKADAGVAKHTRTLGHLQAASARLQATLAQQKAATIAAADAHKQSEKALNASNRGIARNQAAMARAAATMTQTGAQLAALRDRYRDLAAQIIATDQPSAALQQSFRNVQKEVRAQQKTFDNAKARYAASRAEIERLRVSLTGLQATHAATNAALTAAAAAQEKSANSLSRISQRTNQVTSELGRLQNASQAAANSAAQLGGALTQARTDLAGVQAQAAAATGDMNRLAGAMRGSLLRVIRDTQGELARYKAAWQGAEAAVRAAMQRHPSGAPLTAELQALIDRARATKKQFTDTQAGVQQMRNALRAAGNDVQKLQAAFGQFHTILGRIQTSSAGAAAAQQQLASASRQAASAVAKSNAGGREAISWAQRLRGELIALAMAYGGLYGAINQLTEATKVFMAIEAAQSRMLVAFENQERVGVELAWVREQAKRLGIEMGTLADEYSKFAVSAKGSALEGEQTRRIFLAVSEAARVNKLSLDQIKGTYTALSQMMSKGTVSMEELRQQLGERLPGAFTLAARAMNMTGKELSDLIATGGLATDEFLPKFAEELNKTFGGALQQSLQSLTTQIGQFQNTVFGSRETFNRGGWIEGFRQALKTLTDYMDSDAGQTFFYRMGSAAGAVVQALARVVDYIDLIIIGLTTMAGVKVAGVFTSATAAAAAFGTRVAGVRASLTTFRAIQAATAAGAAQLAGALTAAGVSASRATAMITGLQWAAARATVAVRALWVALGGPIGIAITAISAALGYWLSGVDDVTDAMSVHQSQMMAVLDAYDEAKKKSTDWAKELKDLTPAAIAGNAAKLRQQMKDLIEEIGDDIQGGWFFNDDLGPLGDQLRAQWSNVAAGGKPAVEFLELMNKLLEKNSGASKELRDRIGEIAPKVQELAKQQQALADVHTWMVELGLEVEDLPLGLRKIVRGMEDLAATAGKVAKDAKVKDLKTAYQGLAEVLQDVRGKIPSFSEEMKLEKALRELDELKKKIQEAAEVAVLSEQAEYKVRREAVERAEANYAQARGTKQEDAALKELQDARGAFEDVANNLGTAERQAAEALWANTKARQEILAAYEANKFQDAFKLMSGSTDARELSSRLIREREGFRTDPYTGTDGRLRAGFGSDTITLADGTVQKVTEGMKVSVADANRDLERRIEELQQAIIRQIGPEAWSKLNAQQQAVLTSNAYDYGGLQPALAEAVRNGSQDGVVEALKAEARRDGGINANRRNEEAYLYGSAGRSAAEATREWVEQELKAEEKRVEQARKQAEQAAEYRVELERTLALREQDLATGGRLSREEAIRRAVAEETRKAAARHAELLPEHEAAIRRIAAAEWDAAEAKREQSQMEDRLSSLQSRRAALQERITFAQEQGDIAGAGALKQQLADLDKQLLELIKKAIAFQQTLLNNPETRDAALARIEALLAEQEAIEATQQKVERLWPTLQQYGEAFGKMLSSAMDGFLDRIRETGDLIGSLKEAFRQFASDFLLQIAKMIAQQAILNALQAASGGGGGFFGAAANAVMGGVFHEGGVVGGGSAPTRAVAPSWFRNAVRYHSGGIAGLKPNEVPAILEKGEEVLTEDDPRHVNNGGGAQQPMSVKIVNALDAADFVSQGVEDVRGQKAILNFIQANQGAVRGALGI